MQTRTLYDLPDGAKQWNENPNEDARIRASERGGGQMQNAVWQTP